MPHCSRKLQLIQATFVSGNTLHRRVSRDRCLQVAGEGSREGKPPRRASLQAMDYGPHSSPHICRQAQVPGVRPAFLAARLWQRLRDPPFQGLRCMCQSGALQTGTGLGKPLRSTGPRSPSLATATITSGCGLTTSGCVLCPTVHGTQLADPCLAMNADCHAAVLIPVGDGNTQGRRAGIQALHHNDLRQG